MARDDKPRLTPRQHQIMVARATGRSLSEIGWDLGISTQTVKNHVTVCYEALGVETLAEAFLALGWLRVPGQEDAA